MGELPSHPQAAAEREAAESPPGGDRDLASWGRRLAAYLLDVLIIMVPLVAIVVVRAA